ncbi:glutathione S-transferase family protein [Agaribacter flavus]|uniref:Glutathione S-transferase family protein n=1 Tax=Agaribacter flavus TaxID=1902781 RepID=A0ABV7FIU1_9ALTE
MIDLYLWRTPNGYKPLIFAEEAAIEYRLHPVNISKGQQFEPAFLEISPNNKIPALVDGSLSIFESGAILLYLAQKYQRFMPSETSAYYEVMQWLMWQIGGLGPMMGQAGHFKNAAPSDVPYAKERYFNESHRLLSVLEKQLTQREFIAEEYSIADIAIFPWVYAANGSYLDIDLGRYPNTKAWMDAIAARPAVIKSYEIGAGL